MPEPIAPRLLRWAKKHGRHDLPWQKRSASQQALAYRVWVSEIMLQQTQVATVIPYFERFMQSFPDIRALADAALDDVLAHWSGLGYYARARNLHKAATVIRDRYNGSLPAERHALEALPGIGRSTAAAILALAHEQAEAILDGNAKRVLARYHAVPGWPGETVVLRQLWTLAEQETPVRHVAAYTQAIMDLGAMICRRGRPDCEACPLQNGCQARAMAATADYPGVRPRRQQPQRCKVFGILRNADDDILLHKRPPVGIWGGLWCLPEWPDEADCQAWLEQHTATPAAFEQLPPIEHVFTHFRLQIRPLQVRIADTTIFDRHVNDTTDLKWYPLPATLALGLPAPIRTLLESLQSRQQENQNDAHGALRKTG